MIDIRDLKALIKLREIAITEHARKRLIERGISVDLLFCNKKLTKVLCT